MRTKVTIALLFLNAALFFYIFQFGRIRLPDAEGRRVLGPLASQVDSFTRSASGQPDVRVEKRQGEWWITAPTEWPANPNAIARVLNELQFLEHETAFSVADLPKSGQSLADFGLTTPSLSFTFTSGGRSHTLKLGDTTQVGQRLYLLSPDGARIHVVNRSVADSLGLPVSDLRADTVFTIPPFEARSLAVQTTVPSDLKIRFHRDADRWTLEAPILTQAAKNAVNLVLTNLAGLTPGTFLDARDTDLTRTGLDKPQLRVTIEGNARRETLLLGQPLAADADLYYARLEDRPTTFTLSLSPRLLADLRRAHEALRETRLLDFNTAALSSVTLTAPDQPPLIIQRLDTTPGQPESWQVLTRASDSAPRTLPADNDIAHGLIEKLQLLSATKFLSDAPAAADLETYGFNRPDRIITLNLGGAPAQTLTLEIGTLPGRRDKAYARLTSAPYLYEIPPDFLTDTPAQPLHYRQRLLRALPAGTRITAITLTPLLSPNATPLYTHTLQAGETWETAFAAESEARRTALNALLNSQRSLRAQHFVSDTFDATQPAPFTTPVPWAYRLDVTLTLDSAASGATTSTTSTLYITDRLGGMTQLVGTTDFGGVVFAAAQDMVDALFALTYTPPATPTPEGEPAETSPTAEPGKTSAKEEPTPTATKVN